MRSVTLTALILMAGVTLAQNPFRDLAPPPEPEPEPVIIEPINIDIPEAPVPEPLSEVNGFPALPTPGAYESSDSQLTPTVNVPTEPVVFTLPDLSRSQDDSDLSVSLRNPLYANNDSGIRPLTGPLPNLGQPTEEPEMQPETAENENAGLCVDAAVLATSGGSAPTALIRCDGITHLLRVGDAIPGSSVTIQEITPLGVTLTHEGQGTQLQLAQN